MGESDWIVGLFGIFRIWYIWYYHARLSLCNCLQMKLAESCAFGTDQTCEAEAIFDLFWSTPTSHKYQVPEQWFIIFELMGVISASFFLLFDNTSSGACCWCLSVSERRKVTVGESKQIPNRVPASTWCPQVPLTPTSFDEVSVLKQPTRGAKCAKFKADP